MAGRDGEALRKVSIHAPREGSDGADCRLAAGGRVSIHAPREGSDVKNLYAGFTGGVSIHAPREGSDLALSS